MQKTEPLKIQPRVSLEAAGKNYGRFAVAPLAQGHGSPLGNALRRVLLSSIPGAAITRIKLGGVIHEFSVIPGVLEDGTQLVLNVKGIRLRSYSERAVSMQLIKQGPGPVFASDIDTPSTVEIVNPQHYVCSIDNDSVFEMQLTAERGRGTSLADNNSGLSIGEIAIDALFSPVPQVNFVIEKTRVGLDTLYERLILEIWTDGTIKPGDALGHAAQVLTQHFGRIAVFDQPEPVVEIAPPPGRTIPADIYHRTIDELGLSTRTYNSLRRADITTIGRLLELDDRSLQGIRNLGPKGVDEIRQRLAAVGYLDGSELALLEAVAELVDDLGDDDEGDLLPDSSQPGVL
ncbi:DNA-directed RNA polymerase subunit alpha [Candidatus Viridilinea mediisalina]|uniref:DNA-directed RNA polymerase subunit alpha n=1 Tax=Candidatus Viridilinea mediisalina TaxID=2024553 RepID=A0A2A6RJB3_9CHLR|nr:DNA-directed RNA polymerase subunit alpha [Candidatus Viridilinea mediisalina]PDW03214.1 DNA-directed RNA polymerase subunit alpha [Candidatus Viridilinea mediisalina]